MKYLALSIALFISLITVGQLTPVEKHGNIKEETLSSVKHRKDEEIKLIRQIRNSDTTFYWVINQSYRDAAGVITFKETNDILGQLCLQFKKHLDSPYHTNNTFELGNTLITLVADQDKKGRKGVQVISEKGVFTLWDIEAETFFCNKNLKP